MKALPKHLSKNGYEYILIRRGKRSCIYAQHVSPSVTRYEVFRIKYAKERTVKGKLIPAHEKFPGNEDFGKWAWCCWDLPEAIIKFNALENKGQ